MIEDVVMSLSRLFTEHPASLEETYYQHRRVALSYAFPWAAAAAAAFIHAFFPFLLKTTASLIVKRLYERMTKRCFVCPAGPTIGLIYLRHPPKR